MSLGEKISSLRKSQGISQEQLAESSRVSLRTIQRIESGASVPRLFTVSVIANALGVPVDQLTLIESGTDPDRQPPDLEKLRLINWCVLTVFILPLSNVIIPWLIWRKNRNIPLINIIGGRIVSFQILWTIGSFFSAISTHAILRGLNSVSIGHLPPTFFLVYCLFLLVNFIFVLQAGIRLSKGETSIYSFSPNLI